MICIGSCVQLRVELIDELVFLVKHYPELVVVLLLALQVRMVFICKLG